uniref:Uncharacterized protein n=1 Tax=Heterorhabditis bacteriophora TaxID=37862 RepID=A0A1I7XMU2_HETBA
MKHFSMDEIMSVSVYKEIGALMGDRAEKKKDIFDPDHVRTAPLPEQAVNEEQIGSHVNPISDSTASIPDDPVHEKVVFSTFDHSDSEGGYDSTLDEQNRGSSPKSGNEIYLPAIHEESNKLESPDDCERRRACSDVTHGDGVALSSNLHRVPISRTGEERPRSYSELDAPLSSSFGSRFSPNAARRSFGKLSRTLSARAKSLQGTVTQGTKQVAHGVVSHTKSAADSLQTGIETGVKVVGEAANAAANQAKEQRSAFQLKREQSLATLEGLKQKTQLARDVSVAKVKNSLFACATSSDEMPDLFLPVDEIVAKAQTADDASVGSSQLPYYMAVRLTRKKRKTRSNV